MVDIVFFFLAAVFYGISTVAYVACWIGGSRRCEHIAQPALLAANLEQRRREVPRVRAIVGEEVTEFLAWLRARDVVPTIVDLRQHVDGLREAELAWALNKLEGLSDQQRNIVLAFSQRLVNKIMHQPTIRLKQHANGREATRYTEAVRDLFGIGDDECSADGGRAHG